MNYYKATIQYAGTNYFGFQYQKGIPTIQDDLNRSLSQILVGKVTTMGSSRTDTGVHALNQIVKIAAEDYIGCELLLRSLNAVLPPQIRCLGIDLCDASFRPTSHSASKEYRYLFTNIPRSVCLDQLFIANHPYPLNFDLMKECTQMILGEHNFQNFCSAGSNVKTTIRNILACELSEVDPHLVLPQDGLFFLPPALRTCYQFKIEGNGFLKQMVRHLMSAVWLVGRGKISPAEFSLLLKGPTKLQRLWKVAPPRGLFLYQFK